MNPLFTRTMRPMRPMRNYTNAQRVLAFPSSLLTHTSPRSFHSHLTHYYHSNGGRTDRLCQESQHLTRDASSNSNDRHTNNAASREQPLRPVDVSGQLVKNITEVLSSNYEKHQAIELTRCVLQACMILDFHEKGLLVNHNDALPKDPQTMLLAMQETLRPCMEWLIMLDEFDERVGLLKFMANAYTHGKFGFPQDVEVALKYRQEAADMGDSEAALLVGLMYLDGYNFLIREGIEEDDIKLNEQDSIMDRLSPEKNMKFDEESGTWSYEDPRSKRRKLAGEKRRQKAMQQKSNGPQKPPGVSLRNCHSKLKESTALAVPHLKIAARGGYATAQVVLAKLYAMGENDMEGNMKWAIDLLELAAAQNDTSALFNLGQLYYSGVEATIESSMENLPWDYDMGRETNSTTKGESSKLTAPSSSNNDNGDTCEGESNYVPFVVKKSMSKAVEYFDRAAQLGHTGSQFWLGHAYLQGQGVAQDKRRAILFLTSAMKANHPGAIFYIGLMYKNGDVLSQDKSKWEKCFQKAVEQKWGPALYMLADSYYHGNPEDGREKNLKKAFKYYADAGETGHADALYCLGTMFYKGEGTERDLRRAYYAYSQAAEAGSKHAMMAIASMALKGEGIPKDEKYARHILDTLKQLEKDEKAAVGSKTGTPSSTPPFA